MVGHAARIRKSPFIRYFDKTPPGIFCPHFWLLVHANGCPYRCDYCYLMLTFRQKKCESFTNLDDMEREIAAWLTRPDPSLLNSGELSDSLAVDARWFARAYRLFCAQERHALLLLTKSLARELDAYEPHPAICVSFSVNSARVSGAYEHGAPAGPERLEAAARLRRAGWRVRIRLDPMLPIAHWQEDYAPVADRIAEIQPERVTLGTLRYFPQLPGRHPNFPRVPVAQDGPDGRMRLPEGLRREMYTFVKSRLSQEIALCKETDAMSRFAGASPRCNCTV
jgi:spore photoproduct lyase